MLDLRELMAEVGFEPDHAEVDTLLDEQHYGRSLAIGYKLLGDFDDE